MTYSQRPTPPAWGQTGTPNLEIRRVWSEYVVALQIASYNVLGSHQEDSKHFTDTGETARVNLDDVDSLSLEKLLEDHPVMSVLSRCNTDAVGLESLADGSVALKRQMVNIGHTKNTKVCLGTHQDVIGSCRLLDEPWLHFFELLDVFDGLWDIPNLSDSFSEYNGSAAVHQSAYLVGIDHEYSTSGTGVLSD